MNAAQDPDEQFDIVTYLGEPTGITKRRADVHRDGDWHRAIHIWVVSVIDGVQSITFQRRSMTKDTLPGAFDVTVGGHLASGETLEDAFRETDEEIGATFTPDIALLVGRRLGINERHAGVIDHEVQDVFFVRDDRPLDSYRPNPAELAGLVRLAIDDLLDLLAGERDSAPVDVLSSEDLRVASGTISRAEFARLADTYWYRVAIAAKAMLEGERHFSV